MIDLSNQFRRSIVLEMMRMAASNPSFSIVSITLDNRPLSLEVKEHKHKPNATDLELQNLMLNAHANVDRLWRKYDRDRSGTVDKHEIKQLLTDLN